MTSLFSQYLLANKEKYLRDVANGNGHQWTVVAGNEAGDLDSIVSALGYAWHASTNLTRNTIAITHTNRADLKLRPENIYAFNSASIDPNQQDILCIDDVPDAENPYQKFVLVDHNVLHPHFIQDNPAAEVLAIIDHHEDEGLYPEATPRIIQVPTGSCSSLVTNFIALSPNKKTASEIIPPELASLLLSAVLIDTNGLKEGGKAVQADREAANILASCASIINPDGIQITPLDQSKLFQDIAATLNEKKDAVSGLSSTDLLRRDYKEYNPITSWSSTSQEVRVGLSTVPLSLAFWLDRDGPEFLTAAESYMTTRNLGILGILLSFKDEKTGKRRRRDVFIVRDGALGDETNSLETRLWQGLESDPVLKLARLKKEEYDDIVNPGSQKQVRMRAYEQGNKDATRKVMAPTVLKIVEGTAR